MIMSGRIGGEEVPNVHKV